MKCLIAIGHRAAAWACVGAFWIGFASSAHAAPASKKNVTGSDDYVTMRPLTATVARRGAPEAVLHVEVGLEIKDASLRRKAVAAMPRLRAGSAEALRTYVGAHYAYGRVPDGDRIVASLQEVVDKVLNDTGAQVLLSLLVVHKG